jgi:hypothetical protein
LSGFWFCGKVIAELCDNKYPRKGGQRVLMTEKINLREIFESNVRNSLFRILIQGSLRGWDSTTVLKFVDEAMEANKRNIDAYLYQQNVTLLSMNEHILVIVNKFLIPYLDKKRVQ